jgi:hypothetical protein
VYSRALDRLRDAAGDRHVRPNSKHLLMVRDDGKRGRRGRDNRRQAWSPDRIDACRSRDADSERMARRSPP